MTAPSLIPSSSAGSYILQRRSYFRKNNSEFSRPIQVALKLEEAGIQPRYSENVIAVEMAATVQCTVPAANNQQLPAATLIPTDTENSHLHSSLTSAFQSHQCRAPIPWSSMPAPLVPSSHMPPQRARRKEHQLQNMTNGVRALLENLKPRHSLNLATEISSAHSPPSAACRPVLVDFCCSSGHLGFPLAFLLPHCDVILLEHNAAACARAKQRLDALQRANSGAWTNLRIVQAGLQSFEEPFDVGVGVHACGWLSDVIQIKCFQHRAAFLLAPCCIGKLKVGTEGMTWRAMG
jgi:hypothetical protein